MLINMVEAVSCENQRCAEFAKVITMPRNVRRYYCPTCSSVTRARGVDEQVLRSPNQYAEYLGRMAEFDSLPG
ncbi:MAG: hypothetical protein Q7T82_13265 [Armatimonadota bacterium]|nr:hypothetical protein [Armatimonadota bacterium]